MYIYIYIYTHTGGDTEPDYAGQEREGCQRADSESRAPASTNQRGAFLFAAVHARRGGESPWGAVGFYRK